MGVQRAVPEGDAAGADDLADVGGEGVQSFQVAVDPAPQESLVEVAAAAQAQVQGGARGRRGGQGRAQRGTAVEGSSPRKARVMCQSSIRFHRSPGKVS